MIMIEKEKAREATSIDILSTNRYIKSEAEVCFTIIVNNKSNLAATKGSITVFDVDSGDATGVLFDRIPSSSSDGRTVQIAGLPEVVVVHFECDDPGKVWNGALNGPNIPNPIIINLT
jgi:hypothetical protein